GVQGVAGGVEGQQEGPHRRPLRDRHGEVEKDAERALAAGEIGQRQRRPAVGAEPLRRLLGGQRAASVIGRHVEASVVLEPEGGGGRGGGGAWGARTLSSRGPGPKAFSPAPPGANQPASVPPRFEG